MLRTDSGTAYRGAYGKLSPGGLDVERRGSGSGAGLHQELPAASSQQNNSALLNRAYSGPFQKDQAPPNLQRPSQGYAGPYGSGTKLNELDPAAGVHEIGTPQLNPAGLETTMGSPSGQYHGALSRKPPSHPS